MIVNLPGPVAAIFKAVEQLEAAYPGRKFTPDGHLVGSIGESAEQAEIVYDGPGEPVWAAAGKMQKNGPRVVGFAKLRALRAGQCSPT